MACGCLMIMTGIFGTLSSVFSLNPFTAVLDLYILCFGIISVCLEYKDQVMVKRNVDIIRREFHFITTPWGRAAFYFFSGILMVASGGILEIISGLFLMIVGAVIYYSCHNAYAALNKLHDAKYSETMLLEKFKEFDLDKDDHLNTKEFSEVCIQHSIKILNSSKRHPSISLRSRILINVQTRHSAVRFFNTAEQNTLSCILHYI
jgi:COPI associated protein